MTEPSRLQPERILLRSLVPLVAHRAEMEQQIASGLRTAVSGAENLAKTSQARAREQADLELAEMERKHKANLELLSGKLDELVSQTEEMRDRELSKFAISLSDLEHKAEQQAEEAAWLAETVGESTLRKAALAHETATKSLQSRREAVELAAKAARDMLAKKSLTLPQAPPAPAPEGVTVTPELLDRSALDLAVRIHNLDFSLRPFLLRGEGVALVIFAAVVLGAGVPCLHRWPPVPV